MLASVAEEVPQARRSDLVIRSLGETDQHVVKDPGTGSYFNLGAAEVFLLNHLDGVRTSSSIREEFEKRFNEPLSDEDLQQFLDLARVQGLLLGSERASPADTPPVDQLGTAPFASSASPGLYASGQSILYWRARLFDPDALLGRWAPRLSFLWTRTFFWISISGIVTAFVLSWLMRRELAAPIAQAWRWETLVLAWVVLLVATMCHEFAHGLTCKRHGGEVHEIGFLLMFFMPCFYCNVTDAWLIREKSKRLWVTLAGTYCDMVVWALAVFIWAVCQPGTLPNYLAWVVLSVCGVRIFLNMNPLLKLDGYYMLSDAAGIPNLRSRSMHYLMAWARRLLWGAPRPEPQERGGFLLAFGLACWLFSFVYLGLFLIGLGHLLGSRGRWLALGLVGVMSVYLLRMMLADLTGGEVVKMLKFRRRRASTCAFLGIGLLGLLCLWQVEDRASGQFRLRPAIRAELRAPVSGFLHAVYYDEGDRVDSGIQVARMEIPDLSSRIAQKSAELNEAQAKLRLLEAGPRHEKIDEQRQRVLRARNWRDLAQSDLKRKQKALQEELAHLDEQMRQAKAEADFATSSYQRAKKLLEIRSLAVNSFQEAEKNLQVSQSHLEQVATKQRAVKVKGTLEDEAELARREKELADDEAQLKLLEAGSRPEEIEAQRACVARLVEERRYFEGQRDKLDLKAPVSGLITTPRLREKVGQYFKEGELITEVFEPRQLEAEISLEEQQLAPVQAGQATELRTYALPFETFAARVERIAPAALKAERQELQSTIMVISRLPEGDSSLRPGMTGWARIDCGQKSLASILTTRVMRYLRLEFWW